MATFIRRNRTASFTVSLAVAGSLAGLSLLAQSPPQPGSPGRPIAEFRHFPGGKAVPGLEAGSRAAAGPLAADANRELPPGVRVPPGARPVVSAVGANQLYRFALEYDGVPLAAGTDYVAVLRATGRVLASRARNLPETVDATQPTIDAATASAVAAADARQTFGLAGTLTVASPRLEIWVDSQGLGRLNWMLVVGDATSPQPRSVAYRVAATGNPDVLAARERRYEGTVHAQGNVWQTSPLDPLVSVALPHLGLIGDIVTDTNGDAAVESGLIVGGRMRGPFAEVIDFNGPELATTIETTGGADVLDYDVSAEFELAQTTAFYWTTLANRWAREILPSLNGAGTALDDLRVFVNQDGLECNGFSDGSSFTLGSAGAGCRNMATPTVIVHEFGHVLHAQLAEDFFDAAFSEGFGDAVSAFVTGDPCIGRDALGPGGFCFRDATDVTLYPPSDPDPHTQGQPYAQFAWALGLALGIENAAPLIVGAAAASPTDVADAVHLSFVVDDDDGTFATCSPNQRALEQAADSRTLPRPPTCGPVTTTLTSVTPTSPATSSKPTFEGTTEPGIAVGLFTVANCTGKAARQGTADASGAFAIDLAVKSKSTTTVYAKALPTDGRIATCSNGITYVHLAPGKKPR